MVKATVSFALLTAVAKGQIASFLSNDGLYCAEGSDARATESAISLRKASPIGGLFNETFVVVGASCASRGYSVPKGADDCTLNVNTFFKVESAAQDFKVSQRQALDAWSAAWNIQYDTASLMLNCVCQPGSATWNSAVSECSRLDSVQSSWIHHSLTGDLMMCDQGPFVFNTRTLSTIKASPQLAMHFRDQIAPVPCSDVGFPYIFTKADHCYPVNHIWTATPDLSTDPGIAESEATESNLTTGDPNGFEIFARQNDIGDMEVLDNQLGCNCLADSEVGQQVREWCKTQKHSPIRDWWNGTDPASIVVV